MSQRVVCRSRPLIRDSQLPYQHKNTVDNSDIILTRLRPDGVRQPNAEAWVLIKINYMRMGATAVQPIY